MKSILPQSLPYIPKAHEIISTTIQQIKAEVRLIDSITASINVSAACFENVIKPLVELENEQSGVRAVIAALKYCSPELECRDAVTKAESLWQEQDSVIRVNLYVLIRSVKEKEEHIDQESKKLLDRMLLSYESNGYGILVDEHIKLRRERVDRIEKLTAEFHSNLRENTDGEYFYPEELDGIPNNQRVQSTQDGKEFVDYSSKYFTIMRHAHNPTTRKRIQLGANQRYAANRTIYHQILLLRDENARELGLKSHAASKLPYRSAESTEWVAEVMESLMQILLPFGKTATAEVIDMKHRFLKQNPTIKDDNPTELMPWDYMYYSTLLQKESLIDHTVIAEYFPLDHTLKAMLEIFADCLQLRFSHISEEELRNSEIWHEEVKGWTVWDERVNTQGCFVGYLLVDLTSRPNKYKGNQSVNLQPSYLRPDGTRVYPANTLMCNFSNTPTTGCLLSHGNVITLFHELGHSIHDLVARTKFSRYHGYNVTLELSEGIAMMLEQWCWLPEELKSISLHYTRVNGIYKKSWIKEHPGQNLPPEKIPDIVLETHLARRGRAKADRLLTILIDAMFDMAIHNPTSHEALLQLDEGKLYREIFERLRFRDLPNPSNMHYSYGHLLAGYDAGYYAYICAEIFAADLFQTNFAENPRSRTAWERFRQGILEPGGSMNEMEMLKNFLGGREPDTKALLSVLGLPRETP